MRKQDFDLIYSLLLEHSANDKAREYAFKITLSSFGDKHLFEDLGFDGREVLQEMMLNYYPVLASQKPKNIRWKKFLFNLINSEPPACEKCEEQDTCS